MDEVTLGGRRFTVGDFDRRSVLQDHYMIGLVRTIGADKVLPMEGEADDVYQVRLQMCIVDSLKAPELIAGWLVPEGKRQQDWSPDMAKATAKHIAGLDTQEDRDLVTELSMAVVMGFFRDGVESWMRLQSYGTRASASDAAPSGQTH